MEQVKLNKKHKKLIQAHKNNLIISNMNLKDKYENFENSKLDESKTLLFEATTNIKSYQRYFRGEIVRVKFGINIGSEFSGEHFGIVISKKDTAFNPTLHIIPITSKKHKKTLNIGNILYNEVEIKKLENIYNNEKNEIKKNEIKRVISYYNFRKNTTSYACIDHIKTVSKLSVSKTFFKNYDYLPLLRCSDALLKIIDECIIKEYTLNNEN